MFKGLTRIGRAGLARVPGARCQDVLTPGNKDEGRVRSAGGRSVGPPPATNKEIDKFVLQ